MSRTQTSPVPWLSAEELVEWRSFMALLMTLPAALDQQLRRDTDLNLFEYHVLAALSGAPDRTLGMTDLAALSQGSLSRLSHAVGRLERAGFVQRSACSVGRRRMEATLTDAGSAKLGAAAPGHVREVRRLVLDQLDTGELSRLGAAARSIVAATDPALACLIEGHTDVEEGLA